MSDLSKHPNHCRECQGVGGMFHYYGQPLLAPMSDFEYCPHCVGKGLDPLDTTRTTIPERQETTDFDWTPPQR